MSQNERRPAPPASLGTRSPTHGVAHHGSHRHSDDGQESPDYTQPRHDEHAHHRHETAQARAGHDAPAHAGHASADEASAHSGHAARGGRGASSLTRQAVSATLHCLTGCAIGEVLGLVIATALGWSLVPSIVIAIVLAFIFGYSLSVLPLRRAGLPITTALTVAFAADTLSITVMEIVDNAVMVAIPGAMHAGLSSPLFWGSMAIALAVAFVITVPVNRWLIGRGKGHAVMHQYH